MTLGSALNGFRNFWPLKSRQADSAEVSIEELSTRKQLQRLRNEIRQLQSETECLMRSVLNQDPWLAQARDMHRGERCYLLGCGPSLKSVDLARLNDSVVMGVNGTYAADELQMTYYTVVSQIFWNQHVARIDALRCQRSFLATYLDSSTVKTPISPINLADHGTYQRLNVPHPWGFAQQPQSFLFGGGTVIYVCLQLLYYLGFQEVVLLGVDHNYEGYERKPKEKKEGTWVDSSTLRGHFLPNYYPEGVQVCIDLDTSESAYRIARHAFEADGRQVLNATAGTKLDVFELVDLDQIHGAPVSRFLPRKKSA
jgi:hypothetical protein